MYLWWDNEWPNAEMFLNGGGEGGGGCTNSIKAVFLSQLLLLCLTTPTT